MVAAWLLALVWLAPLAYAFWSALHPAAYATSFSLSAPLDPGEFFPGLEPGAVRPLLSQHHPAGARWCWRGSWCCRRSAAYAFARFKFRGSGIAFALVLLQLMIMPDVLIVENYRAISAIGLLDTIPAIALPYLASAFAIFLLRQTFKSIPQELVDAARVEGAGPLQVLWRVYVPLARPTYIAFCAGLGQLSLEQFPLAADRDQFGRRRPLTVGLAVFGAPETGVDWSIISAATLMTMAPLLIAFLLFQRQFVQSFMRAGIR